MNREEEKGKERRQRHGMPSNGVGSQSEDEYFERRAVMAEGCLEKSRVWNVYKKILLFLLILTNANGRCFPVASKRIVRGVK